MMQDLPFWGAIAGGYAGVSAVTFVLYALDKAAARRGGQRTSESALLWWGMLGGWPGGLLAQRLLRHKTAKPSFQWAFWGTVVAHLTVVALVWNSGELP